MVNSENTIKAENQQVNGVEVLSVGGRIDAATLYQLKRAVDSVLNKERKAILFNMADVDYLSSAGLRVILTSYHHMKNQAGKMALCCISKPVFSVIKLAAFDQVIDIFESEEEALTYLED